MKMNVIYSVCVCVCEWLSAYAWYNHNIWRHSCHYLICLQSDLPPPCIWQRYGNRHTFPSPTAYDTHASKNWLGLSQLGLESFSMSASLEYLLVVLNNWTLARQWNNNGADQCALCRTTCVTVRPLYGLWTHCVCNVVSLRRRVFWQESNSFVLWNTYTSLEPFS